MTIGCIIQGDIRRGTSFVIDNLTGIFDYVVLSTWEEHKDAIPSGKFQCILNPKPINSGAAHRNYQRFSTARGIDAAKTAGCTHILKWRTDMLPTKMSLSKLVEYANFSPPENTKSRIVIPAFRNLSVNPDGFSSIPDLFSFGQIDEMERLWGDKGFDYSKNWNMSDSSLNNIEEKFVNSNRFTDVYCPEAELYNLFKNRLNQDLDLKLVHKTIVENYFYLLNHNELGILWFAPKAGFRSVGQAWEHPWWTVRQWKNKSAKVYPLDHQYRGLVGRIRRKISKHKVKKELSNQNSIWVKNFSDNLL